MIFNGTIIITDPCYIIEDRDIDLSDFGSNVGELGIKTYIIEETGYGDWSCTTFKESNEGYNALHDLNENYSNLWSSRGKNTALFNKLQNERRKMIEDNSAILGEFCSDVGLVGVFLLDEVKQYNPNIDEWIESHNWCVTKINNFIGDIVIKENLQIISDFLDINNVSVIGNGNINFFTAQTSL